MQTTKALKNIIPHSINCEETDNSDGLWDRLGRRKMTNMSFFDVFKAPSFALVNSASQSNATGFENDTIPQSFASNNLLIVYGLGNWADFYFGFQPLRHLSLSIQICLTKGRCGNQNPFID